MIDHDENYAELDSEPFGPFANYPIRIVAAKGESLNGYVERFYSCNGYQVPRVVSAALDQLYSDHNVDRAFALIHQAVGALYPLSRDWWVNHRVDRPSDLRASNRNRWLVLKQKFLKFCPQCMRDNPVHLQQWELPLVDACALHKCILVNSCQNCGKHFSWRRIIRCRRCECGSMIETNQTVSARRWQVMLAGALAMSTDGWHAESLNSEELGFAPWIPERQTKDIYLVLARAMDVRLLLAQEGIKNLGHMEKWGKPKLRKNFIPGRWEVRALLPHHQIGLFVSRILKGEPRRFFMGKVKSRETFLVTKEFFFARQQHVDPITRPIWKNYWHWQKTPRSIFRHICSDYYLSHWASTLESFER